MRLLTRESILSADDLRPHVEPVDVPEWGGTVHVRIMTGAERDNFEGAFQSIKNRNLRAFLVVTCACDEDGNGLFLPNDVEALGNKSAAALDRVFEAALRVNKLRPQDVAELEGNSAASRSAGSHTGSPSPTG